INPLGLGRRVCLGGPLVRAFRADVDGLILVGELGTAFWAGRKCAHIDPECRKKAAKAGNYRISDSAIVAGLAKAALVWLHALRIWHIYQGTTMSSPMYIHSVPVFKQMLTALKAILAQANEHASSKSIDPDALLQARLYPDMFPLLKQVQVAAD